MYETNALINTSCVALGRDRTARGVQCRLQGNKQILWLEMRIFLRTEIAEKCTCANWQSDCISVDHLFNDWFSYAPN